MCVYAMIERYNQVLLRVEESQKADNIPYLYSHDGLTMVHFLNHCLPCHVLYLMHHITSDSIFLS